MTEPLHPWQRRRFAELVIRSIAAGTGFTTLVTVGVGADGVPVVSRNAFAPRSLDSSYGDLLAAATRVQRQYPRGVPAYAVALLLPERDVAYLHDEHTASAPARVLTIGRIPVNDRDTHTEVSHGLAAFMRAIQDTQPPQLPTGRAFLAQPGSRLILMPDPPPTQPPPGHQRHHR